MAFTLAFGQSDPLTLTDFSNLANPAGEWYNNHMRPVWWNGFQSRWDGVLPVSTAAGAATMSDWHLVEDLAGTPVLGQLVRSDRFSRPDIFWDETAQVLYLLLSFNSAVRGIYRFDYDDVGDTYTRRAGDPISIPHSSGFKKAVIGKSPNGNLWVVSNSSTTLTIEVNRSADDGDTWNASSVQVKATQAAGDSYVVQFNDGSGNRVGVAATEDDAAAGPAIVHFVHIGEGDAGWTTPGNWTDETGSIPAFSGAAESDDELSATAFNDIVYVCVETGGAATGDDQLVVFKRDGGTWTKHVVHVAEAGVVWKRPNIVIDEGQSEAVVVATDPNNDETAMFRSTVPALSSWSGPDNLFSGVDHYNPHSPQGPTDATSDLLVLGENITTSKVMRQVVLTASDDPANLSASVLGSDVTLTWDV